MHVPVVVRGRRGHQQAAGILRALLDRTGLDPARIDVGLRHAHHALAFRLAVDVELGDAERIAAHEGGDVAPLPSPALAHEQVLPLAQPQHHRRQDQHRSHHQGTRQQHATGHHDPIRREHADAQAHMLANRGGLRHGYFGFGAGWEWEGGHARSFRRRRAS